MFQRTNIAYQYDGSFDGMLTCVFESFRCKETPLAILDGTQDQAMLFPTKFIKTSPTCARRVKRSIPIKISKDADVAVNQLFLSHETDRSLLILEFLQLGFQLGGKVMDHTTDDVIHRVRTRTQRIGNEAHHYVEFLRFSQHDSFLAATFSPKNNVLPLVVPHFCDRLPSENFVIYDKVHKSAFLHRNDGEIQFLHDSEIQFPEPGEEEQMYRRLWRHFYETIAIEGRINPKLRRTMLPQRFWPEMTEFQ